MNRLAHYHDCFVIFPFPNLEPKFTHKFDVLHLPPAIGQL